MALPALSKLKLSAVIGYKHVRHIARVKQLQDLDIIIQVSLAQSITNTTMSDCSALVTHAEKTDQH